MTNKESAATRLLEILQQGHQLRNSGMQQQSALAQLLNVDANNHLEFYNSISKLHSLFNECAEEIAQLPGDKTLFTEALHECRGPILLFNPRDSWGNLANAWTPAILRSFQFVEQRLREVSAQNVAKPSQLREIQDLVQKLRNEITEAEIDPLLQQVLIDHLAAIGHAVSTYRVGGVKSLEKAVERGYGSFMMHRELYKKHKNTSVLTKFVHICEKARSVVLFVKDAKDLLPPPEVIAMFLP